MPRMALGAVRTEPRPNLGPAPQLAISAQDLGKQYFLGELHGGTQELKGAIGNALGRLLGRHRDPSEDREVIWALRHATFDIREGEAVAIVGRNGSGKTTLLRTLARAIPPSEGHAWVRGRVAPLLAVGAGFNPELTGRENVMMSGVILGLTTAEVRERTPLIAEFSGIGRFLDTPVKRYSSGMYIRLAFSIVAHVDADILLADEVLAVGDVEFQHKCMDRMHEMMDLGKTLLFVSHNVSSVRKLCNRALYLSEGELVLDGDVGEVLEAYRGDVMRERPDARLSPDLF